MSGPEMRMTEGEPFPLGASWDGIGVNFALFSAHATRVELCLFDDRGERELERIELQSSPTRFGTATRLCFGCPSRPVYAYRVHGSYDPGNGHRFNPNKLVLDPYAKAHVGALHWDYACFGYTIGAAEQELSFDMRDSALFMPKCLSSIQLSPGDERAPRTLWSRQKPVLDHIRSLGVTPSI